MANKKAELKSAEVDNMEHIDFDELEAKLQNDFDEQLSELEFLKEDREKIGNPENLGNTVKTIVWEQFLNQMANTAGEDFIKENRGLTLDLRNEAHIQTTENFKNGKIATHNDKIDFQKRQDDWKNNFQKDENGNTKTKYDIRSSTEKMILKKEARKPFDENRDKGSAAVNKDHTVPAAEIIRDPQANAHMSKQEKIDFANSDKNLKDLDASANRSKSDNTVSEWLESERKGKKPPERFHIDEEKLREDDRIVRDEYDKQKKEGELKSKKTGKQSQKKEAFKITGKALRSMVMKLLAELVKEVIRKLISWLKFKKKDLKSLISSIKSAVSSFIGKLKNHLINAGNTVASTIATAILGPIVRTINKVFTMIKQGYRSLKEAINYLKSPDNKNKPIGLLILEVGKIVTVGLGAIGALVLGEAIEKGLMAIPVFAIEIPIIGSLASLFGLFLGGLVAGIIGAIAINLIDKAVAKKQIIIAIEKEIKKGNKVLDTQNTIISMNKKKLEQTQNSVADTISKRHKAAANTIKETMENIYREEENEVIVSENKSEFDSLHKGLNKISE